MGQIQKPRKHALDDAGYTAPARQRELDRTHRSTLKDLHHASRNRRLSVRGVDVDAEYDTGIP